jgi:hypothetical protein
MKMSTNDYYTTHSVLLESWQRLRRYMMAFSEIDNRSDDHNRLLETQLQERRKAMVLFHIQISNPLTLLLNR